MRMAERGGIYFALALVFLVQFTVLVIASTSGSSGSVDLAIWDYGNNPSSSESDDLNIFSGYNLNFSSNFTNSTGDFLNVSVGNAYCNISFDHTGSYGSENEMSFDSSISLFVFNRTFNYKGTHNFNISCLSDYGNISLEDTFRISNTAPEISKSGGFIDLDGSEITPDYLQCDEDTLCIYNFTANVTDPDVNDVLVFNYSLSVNTTLTNYTINSSTGILEINITLDDFTGNKRIDLNVRDSDSTSDSGVLRVNVTSANDFPYFTNLTNQSFNYSTQFNYVISASDEEDDFPYFFNITFMSCDLAEWSTRTDCELFNSSQYVLNDTAGFINLSFMPTRNDVGNYTINFTVMDSGTSIPNNATTSQIVNFSVNNINTPPYFRFVCDNNRTGVEDSLFGCFINFTDIDETSNLTLFANYSWFLFQDSGSNGTVININSSTEFNGSAYVNFTPSDLSVGNWSVNLTLLDSSEASNSTVVYFYFSNVNDSVSLEPIDNITVYTSNNYTYLVNASDEDLIVADSSTYFEILNFNSSYNSSGVPVVTYSIDRTLGVTTANFSVDPNFLGTGNHTINISVEDLSGNVASRLFNVTVLGNNAPSWNSSTNYTHVINESYGLYLNLSQNVSDSEGDSITFSYVSSGSFPSFGLDSNTGIINFTSNDSDVGEHLVNISISDGVASTTREFNFTILNVLDLVSINSLTGDGNISGSITDGKKINISEDTSSTLYLEISDDDLRIPSSQKNFYNETFDITLNIQGPNSSLINFSSFTLNVNPIYVQRYSYTFIPKKNDAGDYNITINVSDSSNYTDQLSFSLTVLETEHYPNMTGLAGLNNSILESIYIDFNVSDLEDGNDSVLGNPLSFNIQSLTSGGDFLSINDTTGLVNITLNDSLAGVWEYNITVNDSTSRQDSIFFVLKVYDYPEFNFPSNSYLFSLIENTTSYLNFSVSDSVSVLTNESINYTLYINGIMRNQTTSGFANNTEYLWAFTPNYTDETTCVGRLELNLTVTNQKLSNNTNWTVEINHTNYPLEFFSDVGGADDTESGNSPLTVTLSDYFRDLDASDSCVNQTVGFVLNMTNISYGESITGVVTNWTNATTPNIIFSSDSDSTNRFSLSAFEYSYENYTGVVNNVTSNNFSVIVNVTTVPEVTTTPTSGGGGGGSSTTTQIKIVSLKIIVPDPVSAKKDDKLVLPVSLVNDGTETLKNIVISSVISKSGILRDDLLASFDKSIIESLAPGLKENLTMIVDLSDQDPGLYEITLNATVESPEYSDWAKLYIDVLEEEDIERRLLFTEELVIGNPECVELKELVDEAKKLYNEGKVDEALDASERAITACRQAIEQQEGTLRDRVTGAFDFRLFGILTLLSFVIGVSYYVFMRFRLRHRVSVKETFNKMDSLGDFEKRDHGFG